MAIRIRDNQNLASNPVTNFAGATSFTWVIRLLVDQVTGGSEARFFGGHSYQMFSLRFAGASGSTTVPISVGMTRSSGHLNMSPVNIPRGRVCFLACTYDGSTLRLFLNGQQIGSASGASAAVSGTGPIGLGVVSTTAQARDYHVGDIRVWRNVVLSATQLREARDGLPFTANPGNPFLEWACDGPNDTNVLAGSTVGGWQGVGVQTVSSPPPRYSDRPLAYLPYARLREARIGTSGKTLILRFEDAITGAEILPSAINTAPALTIDGIPLDLSTPGPIWQANTLPYIVYPLSRPVDPSASVRLTAPIGWAQAGVAGETRAESGREVANPGAPILAPLSPGKRAMKVGWNAGEPYSWSPVLAYANLIKQARNEFETASGSPVTTYDPVTRFPSEVRGGELSCRVVVYPYASHDPRGYPNVPSGQYVLLWDGPGNARIVQDQGGHAFVETSSALAGETNRRRTYNLTLSANPTHSRGAQFRLIIGGRISNVRFYGPGTQTDGSAKFHPDYLRMLEGSRLIRFMDATVTNTSCAAHHGDLARAQYFTHDHGSVFSTRSAQVVSIGPYANPGEFFFPNLRAHMLVTTAAPHGFTDGQGVRLGPLAGGPGGQGRVRLVNGTDLDLITPTQFAPTPCRVVSPTSFAITLGAAGATGPAAQPDGTQAVTGTAQVQVKPGMPFTDCVELSNLVGADPWICVPHAFTDEACAALATDVVAALGAGRKVYVEYSNEHWNFSPYFQQSYFNHGMAMLAGLSDSAGYAKRAGEVHAIFAAVFAAAGRPGDLIRVFGAQAGNPGITSAIVNYCAPRGIPIDAVAIAPYFQNFPRVSPERWLALDMDQVHDLSDLTILRHGGFVSGQKEVLRASYPAAKVVCYEGGIELGVPAQGYGSQANQDRAAAMSRAWSRHPRILGTVLQYCQNLEQEGCDAFAYYRLAGTFGSHDGLNAAAAWAAYQRTDEPVGLGDGSDGLFDNRVDPQDMSRVVSVVGAAVKQWLALAREEEETGEEEGGGEGEGGRANGARPRKLTPGQMRGPRSSARPRPRLGR